jgi:hypothetical protein
MMMMMMFAYRLRAGGRPIAISGALVSRPVLVETSAGGSAICLLTLPTPRRPQRHRSCDTQTNELPMVCDDTTREGGERDRDEYLLNIVTNNKTPTLFFSSHHKSPFVTFRTLRKSNRKKIPYSHHRKHASHDQRSSASSSCSVVSSDGTRFGTNRLIDLRFPSKTAPTPASWKRMSLLERDA